jgi:hypothetical protein
VPSLFHSEMVSRATYQSLITIGGLVKTRDRRLEELGGRASWYSSLYWFGSHLEEIVFDLLPRHLHFTLPNRFRGRHFAL